MKQNKKIGIGFMAEKYNIEAREFDEPGVGQDRPTQAELEAADELNSNPFSFYENDISPDATKKIIKAWNDFEQNLKDIFNAYRNNNVGITDSASIEAMYVWFDKKIQEALDIEKF